MNEAEIGKLMDEAAEGKAAERMLVFMGDYIHKERQRIEEEVFKTIEENGYLEERMAVQAWIQVHALALIPRRLRRTARLGKVAGEKIEAASVTIANH